MPVWYQGGNYTTQLGTPVSLGCHYPTSSMTDWCPSSCCLWKYAECPEPLAGCHLHPSHSPCYCQCVNPSYFSDFLVLLRTGKDGAEMQKTHPKTVFSPSLVPCCHLPLSPLQLSQHEQELSQSDFSPTGAERFRHLLGKASWEVSNFFFFLFFCKCKLFSCTLGKHPSPRLLILKLFQGWIASLAQSPIVQLLNVSEFTSDLCTREARLPPVPNAEETAFLHFSHLILEQCFVCHWKTQPKAQQLMLRVLGLAHSCCSPRSIQRLWLLTVSAEAVCGADNFLQNNPTFLSKIWLSLFFVDSHQCKRLKNNLDFSTQHCFSAITCMKSTVRFFAPPDDPDPRADASGLPLQSQGRNVLLKHHFCYPKVDS